jgi:hypothetical protein
LKSEGLVKVKSLEPFAGSLFEESAPPPLAYELVDRVDDSVIEDDMGASHRASCLVPLTSSPYRQVRESAAGHRPGTPDRVDAQTSAAPTGEPTTNLDRPKMVSVSRSVLLTVPVGCGRE